MEVRKIEMETPQHHLSFQDEIERFRGGRNCEIERERDPHTIREKERDRHTQ
jgi:hypothetical protein